MNGRIKNITNQKFGRLTAASFSHTNKFNKAVWLCVCDCGGEKLATYDNLLKGDTKSCGCNRHPITHGVTRNNEKTPEYTVWQNMKARCYLKGHARYKDWGGRGIRVCSRWKKSFGNFIADMGLRPSTKHSIDRIDNDGNYTPENCRWATKKEQIKNRNNTRWLIFNRHIISLSEFSELVNKSSNSVLYRLRKKKETPEDIYNYYLPMSIAHQLSLYETQYR